MSQPHPTIGTVIAPDKTALRVGSAKLIVDGTDTTLARKAEIALRPSRVRARLAHHPELFSAQRDQRPPRGLPGHRPFRYRSSPRRHLPRRRSLWNVLSEGKERRDPGLSPLTSHANARFDVRQTLVVVGPVLHHEEHDVLDGTEVGPGGCGRRGRFDQAGALGSPRDAAVAGLSTARAAPPATSSSWRRLRRGPSNGEAISLSPRIGGERRGGSDRP
jgi:hypothetical protein